MISLVLSVVALPANVGKQLTVLAISYGYTSNSVDATELLMPICDLVRKGKIDRQLEPVALNKSLQLWAADISQFRRIRKPLCTRTANSCVVLAAVGLVLSCIQLSSGWSVLRPRFTVLPIFCAKLRAVALKCFLVWLLGRWKERSQLYLCSTFAGSVVFSDSGYPAHFTLYETTIFCNGIISW